MLFEGDTTSTALGTSGRLFPEGVEELPLMLSVYFFLISSKCITFYLYAVMSAKNVSANSLSLKRALNCTSS